MQSAIKILHLEDDPIDSQLVRSVLKNANVSFEYFFADNEQDYLSCLKNQQIDVILSDYKLPDYSGLEALQVAKTMYPHIPFIFVSGTMGEDAAIESLLNGATDYVLKNKINRLGTAVNRVFKEAQEQKARQQAESELRKLSRAIDQSPNSIFITDTNGMIEYVNPTTEKITGYKNEELIGKNPRIFSSGKMSPEIYSFLWQTIKSGKDWKGELHNKKKNGELFWESATISPILNDNGKITNYVAIKEDITERKKLTIELIAAKEKAEENDKLKTAFLHNISHEIRTPINAIEGFSGFLKNRELPIEKREYFIDIIVQSSNQLLSIISDIINIATIEAGQERLFEAEFDINATLQNLHDKFLMNLQKPQVNLYWKPDLSNSANWIISDEAKVIQILSNLINNALKFTKQGYINFGYSTVETDRTPFLQFFVEDTGIGIPIEMHEEIFKRFRQVESTLARQFGGSGLGLTISKAYIELLGGKIWLTSNVDKGSTFYFTIPYKKSQKNTLSETLAVVESKNENKQVKTLLIAEDEDSNFRLLEEILSGLNILIIRAVNGLEAVETCKTQPVDMVLMDIKMPVMDGYEATKQIRKFLPTIPIIAQTAYTTDKDKNKTIECGCTDFIGKPFKQTLIISKIKEHLYKT